MTFDEVTRKAARRQSEPLHLTMKNLRCRHVYDEDDVSGFFIGSLQTIFEGGQIGGVTLTASILRHRRGGPQKSATSARTAVRRLL